MEGQSDLGLDLVAIEPGPSENLDENEGERDDGEDEEEEENVVAVENVIGLGGGVVEPEGLGESEVPAKRRSGLGDGLVGQHWGRVDVVEGGLS